ncbi:hypothetical protein [Shewanella frigidimarina]|uniref:hypothetical protein n=1 Tax=Shewanella frigidimarina TaxID=56812 RepID=UPI003D792369
MNNFFKMSLVAAAVALSGTATAGTFTANADKSLNENGLQFSKEGWVAGDLANTAQYLPTVNYTLAGAYIVGDELNITFGGAGTVDTTNSVIPQTVTVGGATFDKISLDDKKVVYRVISGAAKPGDVFTLVQAKVTAADKTDSTKVGVVITTGTLLLAVDLAATSFTNTGTTAIDIDTSHANAGKMAVNTMSQYGTYAVTSKFNAVIDATSGSTGAKFTNSETGDSVMFAYTAPKTMPTQGLLGQNIGMNDLTTNKVTTTVDLTTEIATANLAKYTVSSANGTVGTGAGVALVYPITYASGTAPVAGDTITITPKTGVDAPILNAGGFELLAKVSNAVTSPAVAPAPVNLDLSAATKNAGEWTIIGSTTINVPYMPYGEGLSQVIYVTNTTDSTALVSVVAQDDLGNEYKLGQVATAIGNGVTKLSTPIKNALIAAGFTSGKLSLDITVNGNATITGAATDGSIKLHTGYNANESDRGFVTNTSNGAK